MPLRAKITFPMCGILPVLNRASSNGKEMIIVQVERETKVQGVQTSSTLLEEPMKGLAAAAVINQEGRQRAAMVTGRRIAGTRGSHGGVHKANDPCAPGGSVGVVAVARRRAVSRGGDRRVHDSAHRRHHLAHLVRHEL